MRFALVFPIVALASCASAFRINLGSDLRGNEIKASAVNPVENVFVSTLGGNLAPPQTAHNFLKAFAPSRRMPIMRSEGDSQEERDNENNREDAPAKAEVSMPQERIDAGNDDSKKDLENRYVYASASGSNRNQIDVGDVFGGYHSAKKSAYSSASLYSNGFVQPRPRYSRYDSFSHSGFGAGGAYSQGFHGGQNTYSQSSQSDYDDGNSNSQYSSYSQGASGNGYGYNTNYQNGGFNGGYDDDY